MQRDLEKAQEEIGQKVLVKVSSTSVSNGEINFAYVKKIKYNNSGERK